MLFTRGLVLEKFLIWVILKLQEITFLANTAKIYNLQIHLDYALKLFLANDMKKRRKFLLKCNVEKVYKINSFRGNNNKKS